QTFRQYPLIPAEEQLLGPKFFQKVLPLELQEKRPHRGARAGSARIEVADLAGPFGIQQVGQGTNLFGLPLVHVAPNELDLIRLRSVNVTLRLVQPDVAAPPVVWVFD